MFFLPPAQLRAVDARALEELLGRTELVVAAGAGQVRGLAAAALLFADYAVLDREATLLLDASESWAAAAWRLGRGALRLHVDQQTSFAAAEAVPRGLADEVIDGDADAWLERWMQGRSSLALDSAAALIRLRGGDRLERAGFARLFATGEPQSGLHAFLTRRRS
jgi:hypothetical protein